MSRLSLVMRDAAHGYASHGIPVLPLHYPLPTTATLSRLPAANSYQALQNGRAARVRIHTAASPASNPWQPGAPWR